MCRSVLWEDTFTELRDNEEWSWTQISTACFRNGGGKRLVCQRAPRHTSVCLPPSVTAGFLPLLQHPGPVVLFSAQTLKKKLSLLRIFLLWLPFGCCKYREILKMDESIGNGFKGHDTAQHGHAFAACRQYQVILPTHPTIFPRYMQALRKGAL